MYKIIVVTKFGGHYDLFPADDAQAEAFYAGVSGGEQTIYCALFQNTTKLRTFTKPEAAPAPAPQPAAPAPAPAASPAVAAPTVRADDPAPTPVIPAPAPTPAPVAASQITV